uniref:Secreted protein n=1 Tax=Steinernema glaseri TaxID=37863 RepID=A0A1I7ZTW9_9BILA
MLDSRDRAVFWSSHSLGLCLLLGRAIYREAKEKETRVKVRRCFKSNISASRDGWRYRISMNEIGGAPLDLECESLMSSAARS